MKHSLPLCLILCFFLFACGTGQQESGTPKDDEKKAETPKETNAEMKKKVEQFATVRLSADVSHLSENQKQMLTYMFKAAKIMDDLFWKQSYGDKQEILAKVDDPYLKRFIEINYGPWERLAGQKPFIEGIEAKPKGACFYPKDITEEEFNALGDPAKESLYTLVRRDENGKLIVIPYHKAFEKEVTEAAGYLKKAAELAEEAGLKKYLELRAEALLTDDYLESDLAWMDMKENMIDFVVGPIENYEDGFMGLKAAHEAFILLKDKDWSDKLEKFVPMLPELQAGLPCDPKYKAEVPGSGSDLGVYNVVYYGGDCNAGSKTIAINLPNDERVHLEKGSRKLQLKNAMQAKFDKILVPISNLLIAENQRKHVTFKAFFENTMFHEVAHGLGIKNVVGKDETVRQALGAQYSALEEGKADILGLYMVSKLNEKGELGDSDLMDNFVTFMAGIFRSVRFGVSSSHGKANMVRFYYFEKEGAFTRDEVTGTYSVNFEKMKESMNKLGDMILTIQGDGNFDAAKKLVDENGFIREKLQADLDRINEAGIPVDIVFEQGADVLFQ